MNTAASVAAVLALWLTALSLNVSRLRLRHRQSLGDGGHKDLMVAVRAHGNALEQSLLFVLLLAAWETQSGDTGLPMQLLGVGFCVARVLHAAAMFGRQLRLRQLAHAASVLAQLMVALAILARAW
jgi:uncharacterized protein